MSIWTRMLISMVIGFAAGVLSALLFPHWPLYARWLLAVLIYLPIYITVIRRADDG